MNRNSLIKRVKGLNEKETAIALGVGLFVVYLLTLSNDPLWDSIIYAYAWENNVWQEILHPHHLLGPITGWLLYRGLVLLGYFGRAIWPMAVASAFFGGLASTMLFLSLWELTRHLYVALVSALLFAVSVVMWRFSVEAGVYAMATCVLLGALRSLIVYLRGRETRCAVWSGVLAGLAVVAHEMNLIFAGLAGLLVLAYNHRHIRGVIAYVVPLVLTISVFYGTAGWLIGARQPCDFYNWLTWYLQKSGQEGWGGWYVGRNALKETIFTLTRAIAFTPQKALFTQLLYGQSTNWRDGFLVVGFVIVVVLFLLVWILLLSQWKRAWKRYRLAIPFFCAWFVGYILFVAWCGSPLEGWVFVVIPIWVLLGMFWGTLRPSRYWAKSNMLITLLLIGLTVLNLVGTVLPTHDLNQSYTVQLSLLVEAISDPSDLIIVPNSPLRSAIPYFARRENCISIYDMFRVALVNGVDGYELLRRRIEAEWSTGHRVFVLSPALDLQPEDLFFLIMRTDKESLQAFFNAYRLIPVAQCQINRQLVVLYQIVP